MGTILLDLLSESLVLLLAPLGAAAHLLSGQSESARVSLSRVEPSLHLALALLDDYLQPFVPSFGQGHGLVNLLKIQPSLEAPYLGLVGHEFAETMPRLVTVDVDESSQFFILLWSPHNFSSWCLALPSSLLANELIVTFTIAVL